MADGSGYPEHDARQQVGRAGAAPPVLISPRHGRHLFAFAVIADSHLEPESPGMPAPRSNLRNRRVVDWLRTRAPRFVLHLGDIVHPVPQAEPHDATLLLARQLFAGLPCPVLYTPGNHDIGDKNDDTAPAAAVAPQWLDGYGQVFGAPFQVHHAGGCVLLLINSPILGSGLPLEAAQKRWLQEQLGAAQGKRIFLATHYPPFLAQPQEDTSYDNMEHHARHWLLELLERHRVEAVFCGHVHNLFYNRFGATEIHALPSTSFVRRDYSELHSGAPTDEYGRNDTGKLGFFWVDVYERGHVARLVQTHGGTDTLALQLPGHPKDPGETPLGVNLCHPWCAQVELPFNPPVDPFARRRVRNDHAVQALWSTGIRHLRAPVDDLLDTQVRRRVADMVALGHRFTFFSVGLPSAVLLAQLREHASLIGYWECVLPVRAAPELAACAGAMVRETGMRMLFAALRSGTEGNTGKAPGKHYAAPGFTVGQRAQAGELLAGPLAGIAAGVAFSVARNETLAPAMQTLATFARSSGATVCATRALMGDGPNDAENDDAANQALVEEALQLARRHPDVLLLLDTFMDIDRGYYVRAGLIDRSGNWRAAGRVLADFRADAARLPAGGASAAA
ncbi:metallophosphoesterase [Comamonadaceae bacterium G21597-S1]|nr:metallophosphoesterase [Comamonadaceae bacterium G21597-S1]